MKSRRFGQTEREVSVLGFGAAAISGEGRGYSFGAIDETQSIRLVRACFDAGVTLYDTAPFYGCGSSERRLGKALADVRDKIFLVSKCGITWDEHKKPRIDNAPEIAEQMLEQSLRDLQTDYLDLYMIHWPDDNVDIRRTMEPLARALEVGKIRAIGLSNSYPEDIEKAAQIAPISVLQSQFNLFARSPLELLFSELRERKLGFMTWGTLDKGILTGRVTPDRQYDRHDLRSRYPSWLGADLEPRFQAMAKIQPLLEQLGHTGLELALGYVLSFAEVSTALCGVRSLAQLASAVAALNHLPDAELIARCAEIAEPAVAL